MSNKPQPDPEESRWDNRYRDSDTPWDTGTPSTDLQKSLTEVGLAPTRALELGCGTGTNAVWLAQQGFDCTAIDLSPRAIDRAHARAAAAGVQVRFIQADLRNLPDLGEPFGFLFDRGCYHAVRRIDVKPYLAALERWLAPGAQGLVIAGKPRPDGGQGPPVVTEDELRQELGKAVEIVRLRDFWLDEAPGSNEKWQAWSCWVRKGVH
jgi:SAM-dependent methyltransferase